MISHASLIMFCLLRLAATKITGHIQDNYIGCYYDDVNDHPWLQKITFPSSTVLTAELCLKACRNSTYARLQNSEACLCGNSFGNIVLDTFCSSLCPGNRSECCGGSNGQRAFYSLYTVCEIGTFGNTCDQVCHCRGQEPCDRMTGQCPNGCEGKWFGSTCGNSHLPERYIGCFRDNETRAISPDHYCTDQMTVDSCARNCSLRNNSIAGLQARCHCFCGESYAKYGSIQESDCSKPCAGNRSQICGGEWANSVYYVCPNGFYGPGCIKRCHCYGGGPCRFNGSCLNSRTNPCKLGWTGTRCNIRDCGTRNGDCESDEICETIDLRFANLSVCRCKDGSYRDNNTCKPTHLQYVGCYAGNMTQYISVYLPVKDMLTIEFCIQSCKELNKTYSVIQGGSECLCGDDYGRMLPDAECQVPCAGNTLQYCGGKNTSDGTPIYVVYTAKSFVRGYIGCYQDNRSAAMEQKFQWPSGRNNTIDSCIRRCALNNYKYAGLQYGYVCFCGSSYDKYGPLPEARCQTSCSGNASQICGGHFANSVYLVNDILECSSHSDCKRERNESCNVIDLNYTTISRCRCHKGFHRTSIWEYCEDLNECEAGTSTCDTVSENCFNNIGSYRCECKGDFVNVSGKCEDIDECSNDLRLCNTETELCKNTIGSYMCHCKPGYKSAPLGHCTDVDECQLGSNSIPCDEASQYCVNNVGSYICECKEGYSEQSGKCIEFNSSPAIVIVLATLLTTSMLINTILIVTRIQSARSIKPEPKSDFQQGCTKISAQQEMTYEEISDPFAYEQIIKENRQIVKKSGF